MRFRGFPAFTPSRSMNNTSPGSHGGVPDAGAQAAADKCEMRVGVGRFDRPLLSRQFHAAIQVVVVVTRAFGEHGGEENGCCHRDARLAGPEPSRVAKLCGR